MSHSSNHEYQEKNTLADFSIEKRKATTNWLEEKYSRETWLELELFIVETIYT